MHKSGIFVSEWTSKKFLLYGIISFFVAVAAPMGTFLYLGTYESAWLYTMSNSMSLFLIYGATIFQMIGWFLFLQIIHFIKFKSLFGIHEKKYTKKNLAIFTVLGSATLLGLSFLSKYFLEYFDITQKDSIQLGELIYTFPLGALILLPLVGMMEELFFRGFFQAGLEKRVGGFLAVIFSSLVFTGMHGFQYDLPTLIEVFVMSLLLGIIFWKSKSITLNMLIHGLNNLIAILIIFITTPGIFSGSIKVAEPEFNVFVSITAKSLDIPGEVIKYGYPTTIMKNCTSYDAVDNIIMEKSSKFSSAYANFLKSDYFKLSYSGGVEKDYSKILKIFKDSYFYTDGNTVYSELEKICNMKGLLNDITTNSNILTERKIEGYGDFSTIKDVIGIN